MTVYSGSLTVAILERFEALVPKYTSKVKARPSGSVAVDFKVTDLVEARTATCAPSCGEIKDTSGARLIGPKHEYNVINKAASSNHLRLALMIVSPPVRYVSNFTIS